MNEKISQMEAYLAMFSFLEENYKRTEASAIGSLLRGMHLMDDGMPMERSYWDEWQAAVRNVTSGDVDATVRFSGGSGS